MNQLLGNIDTVKKIIIWSNQFSDNFLEVGIIFLSEMYCVYHGKTKGEGSGHVKLKPPVIFYWPFKGGASAGGVCSLSNYSVVYVETQLNQVSDFHSFVCFSNPKGNPFLLLIYYFGRCIFLHVRPCESCNFGRNYPFGFLLEVFWFRCRCFKCVLLSLWCLGKEGVR